ncbi:HD domain-containing protein [Anoxybacillus flavithermus]|uniref:HD domain-containing protein n=1 Tax=Anoxybacillus flavithermus TaxID=33934 RepID=A0A2G5RSX0_9BACL|nr:MULTISPECIES: HD domain-containing phosphohydrolase [Anoxybacillus]KFZ42548.1 phosphodiesterase [Anoxybacillus sp. KU2-6(11)]PIC05938.1 HD domain-containing protein [Anoxybacillus flavithermus]
MDVYAHAKRTIYVVVVCFYIIISSILACMDVSKSLYVIYSCFVTFFLFIITIEKKIRKVQVFRKEENEYNVYKYIYVLKKQPLAMMGTITLYFLVFIALLLFFHLPIPYLMIAICLYTLWHPLIFHVTYRSLQKVIEHNVYYFFERGYQNAVTATDFVHLSHFQKMFHYGIGMFGVIFAYMLLIKLLFIQSQMGETFFFVSFLLLFIFMTFYIGISYTISKQMKQTFHLLCRRIGNAPIPNIHIDETTMLVHALNSYNDKTKHILSLLSEIEQQNDEYKYIAEHSRRVAHYCLRIGAHIGLLDDQLNSLYHAALLHDIGKLGIPDYILLKKEPLSKDEFSIIKQYPIISYLIAKNILQITNKDLLHAILFHKEHMDGTGYPNQIKVEEIPLLARIISVADAFDAMTSSRPYRDKKNQHEVMHILREESGVKWDEAVVYTLNHLFTKKDINIV